MLGIAKRIFGTANDRVVKKLFKEVSKVNCLEEEISALSDQNLKAKTLEFRNKLQNKEASIDDILYEAFAVVREAAKRSLEMRHFDVQIVGGFVLHRGKIAEMKTGEGKTLAATLSVYVNALSGKGVHVVTPNDYLAKRDSEEMGKLYEFLGLSVGCIISGTDDQTRKAAYEADILYVTNNELGFDFLRDNMKFAQEQKVQRQFNYAIVDEVDSILIDEARTPLIISGPVDDNSELYATIDNLVKGLSKQDYDLDEKAKTIHLTEDGTNHIEKLLTEQKLIERETSLYDFDNMNLVHYVNQAMRAHVMFKKDVDYIVKDGKLIIIDEFTGRIMDGRRYSEGLHQALEAKEKLQIQNENQTLASITFQNFFRMYPKLSGMTGTAMTEAAEFKDIYKVDVVSIPTNNKVTRIDYDDEIYGNEKDKSVAILKLVKECYERGQPILVGTVSIEKSEDLSSMLTKNKIPHNVLNAKYHEKEASIIAQAGRYKAVTIATNMAGRGTDIQLGGNSDMLYAEALERGKHVSLKDIKKEVVAEKEKVTQAGGLFVIGTERHESRRIDNQLRGRSGRQGDPGATRFYLSLEDDLMRIFASERVSAILRNLGLKDGEAIQHPMISKALEKAQQKVEMHNYEIRKNLLKFDDVMNDQRKVIYGQRDDIISSENVDDIRDNMTLSVVDEVVGRHIIEGSYAEDWDLESLVKEVHHTLGLSIHKDKLLEADVTEDEVRKTLQNLMKDMFDHKEELYGKKIMQDASKYILLVSLDQVWKDHLHYLDHLRHGISLRAYGQKDPLNEYKREAFSLFEKMLDQLNENFVQRVAHLQIDINQVKEDALQLKNRRMQKMQESRTDPAFNKFNAGNDVDVPLSPLKVKVAPEARVVDDPSTWGKVARNEACPCGSGKKYKHCHGTEG